MLRRSLQSLAGVAARAQAARAGCVANLHAPSHFSTATAGFDREQKSDRFQHSRLAVAAAWRGYATDIATTSSANSGAITAALKTPTADIRYDENNHSVDKPGDPSKRAFTYFVLTGGRVIYASALRLAVLKFLLSMSASADVLALASLEVDLSKIESGQTVTVKWRGKPVFIRRRTPAEIERENAVDVGSLRDPQTDGERAANPEWLVAVGVCTHLGCVPISNAGDFNGWFCPCHGSHYDASGRIRKGPAPYNLEVPEYKFLDETKMVIG